MSQKKNIKILPLLIFALFILFFAYFYIEQNRGQQENKTAQSQGQNNEITQRQNNQQKTEGCLQKENSKKELNSQNGVYLISTKKDLCIPLSSKSKTGDSSADRQIVNHLYYSLCYRESYEQAEWSAYCLDSEMLVKNASRTDDFRTDPLVTTLSATPQDYKASGYDRGHLTPAADFAFSKEAMSETFYMSNMSPQTGSLNRGIWKDLETSVRQWAQKYSRVFVISGPVLDKAPQQYKTIGKNNVAVPEYYYKVLLVPLYEDENDRATKDDSKDVTAIAFIFPNQKCEGEILDYAVTVDEVEKRTGIDFFFELEDNTEDLIESNFDKRWWQ
ncbi:DNA/RNA non-specific endonuclease [Treponema pectinovorum]|uniref:DNA/RNA non-specific endonuclease n=1 Tax=Treponema pectinovorum TaxID=164 RepID=UPI0011C85318|nr:DNA/RNA non-specific endonuclease [Treponema pectinovorum]